MLISEITQYTTEELTAFTLTEAAEDWVISQSNAFKKGLKKYKNDKRVMDSFKDVMNIIKSHDAKPRLEDFPPEYNAHAINVARKDLQGTTSVHLKGQKIIMLFRMENAEPKNIIELIHMGTHQDVGWR